MNIFALCIIAIAGIGMWKGCRTVNNNQQDNGLKQVTSSLPDFTHSIDNLGDYNSWAKVSGSTDSVVKFVAASQTFSSDTFNSKKVFYFNPKFVTHQGFVSALPEFSHLENDAIYQLINYCDCSGVPKIFTGGISYFDSPEAIGKLYEGQADIPSRIIAIMPRNIPALENNMEIEETIDLILEIADSVKEFPGARLLYFGINSNHQALRDAVAASSKVQNSAAAQALKLEIRNGSDYYLIYGTNAEFVSYNSYTQNDITAKKAIYSFGVVNKISPEDFDTGDYSERDILIFEENLPLDIGPLAGVISFIPQTPLSHIAIRTEEQRIPNFYISTGFFEQTLQPASSTALIGERVFFLSRPWDQGGGNISASPSIIAEADYAGSIEGLKQAYPGSLADLSTDFNVAYENYFATRNPDMSGYFVDNPPNTSGDQPFIWNAELGVNPQATQFGAKGSNFAFLDRALRAAGVDRSLYNTSFLVPFAIYHTHINARNTDHNEVCNKTFTKASAKYPYIAETGIQSDKILEYCTSAGATINSFISQMLANHSQQLMSDGRSRKVWLWFLRELIEDSKFDDEYKALYKEKLEAAFPDKYQRIRMRSSTNAEDLPGISGAGLYTSNSGCLADNEDDLPLKFDPFADLALLRNDPVCANASNLLKDSLYAELSKCYTQKEFVRRLYQVCRLMGSNPDGNYRAAEDLADSLQKTKKWHKTMRKVFASVWNEKAFLFRNYFNIPHQQVYMGVLVHPSYIDETANGVIILKRSLGTSEYVASVSVQVDDISVTNPIFSGSTPEIFNAKFSKNNLDAIEVTYLKLSSEINAAQKILSPEKIKTLVSQAIHVYDDMNERMPDQELEKMDLEFKLDINDRFIMKQARPLNAN